MRCNRLFVNQLIAFAVIGTSFGMAENNILAANVFQHFGADIAGMGAFGIIMRILGTEGDFGAAQRLFDAG